MDWTMVAISFVLGGVAVHVWHEALEIRRERVEAEQFRTMTRQVMQQINAEQIRDSSTASPTARSRFWVG